MRPQHSLFTEAISRARDSARWPTTAINRGEPPPATTDPSNRRRLRYSPVDKLSLILGAFDIYKAYFNLNAANVYQALVQFATAASSHR